MTNQTKHDQKMQKTADAFTYNVLIPEVALFILSITTGFGALLTVFS